jgi:DnaK suppressor protein
MPAKKAATKKKKNIGSKKKTAKRTSRAATGRSASKKRPSRKKSTKRSSKKAAKPAARTSRKKTSKKKTSASKTSRKKTPAKKAARKKASAKKTSKKRAAKKPVRKKAASGRKAGKRAKAAAKPASTKKTSREKTTAKKHVTTKKATARKPSKKKPATARRPVRPTRVSSAARRESVLAGPVRGFTPYQPKRGEDYMSDAQLEHFRHILLAWKRELMEEVDRTMHHMKDDAANFPDPNDRATQESEFGLELRTRDRERKLLRKIDSALGRIDDGSYGYCEETGEEIGLRRLEARPVATLCVEAQERRELAERQFRDREDYYR